MGDVKLCKDCRWASFSHGPAACIHENALGELNVVHGGRVGTECVSMRYGGGGRKCGQEGKLWEPRPTLWERLLAPMVPK
jgi:hypothetical protein